MKDGFSYDDALDRITYLKTQLKMAGIFLQECGSACYLTGPNDNPYEKLGKVSVMCESEASRIRMKLAELENE